VSDQPSKLRLRFETVGSIAAIVVGVAALFVSWDQARVMRAQQHASVLPALQIDGFSSAMDDRVSMGVRFKNNGIGPAVVRAVTLERAGDAREDMDSVVALLPPGAQRSWTSMIGRIIAAGESVEPIRFDWPAGAMSLERGAALRSEWSEWDLSVCYCSVFERCWTVSTLDGSGQRQPVDRCEPSENDVFERIGVPEPQ